MATDGTKIIDGDTAHDTYWGIMDLYDNGAELTTILTEFPLESQDIVDEFEHEIYTTSCGLAYWELGLMTAERLQYLRTIISKDACVKEWAQYSEKEANSRKAVLKRFLKKIEKENTKIRKRKKYRKISNFVFSENSILTFQLSSGEYAVTACIKVDQYRGNCVYWLVPITYRSLEKPSLEQVKASTIIGNTLGCGLGKEHILASQPGIEKIWDYVGRNPNFTFGYCIDGVEHQQLIKLKHHFEKIGELAFIDGLKKMLSIGYLNSFEQYKERYSHLSEDVKTWHYNEYPVNIVIHADENI